MKKSPPIKAGFFVRLARRAAEGVLGADQE